MNMLAYIEMLEHITSASLFSVFYLRYEIPC